MKTMLSLFLLMAWKVAGYYGLDRIALPALTVLVAQFRQQSARKETRESVPTITMPTPALSLDELHGFE